MLNRIAYSFGMIGSCLKKTKPISVESPRFDNTQIPSLPNLANYSFYYDVLKLLY
jgi:hypothetical protein